MPTLSSKPVELQILEPQLPLATLAAIESAQIVIDRFNEISLEPLRQISESISRMMERQNKAMMRIIAAQLSFDNLFPKGLFNFVPSVIIEGEIEETKKAEIVLLPATIPITTPRSKMGLRHISGGNFSYKRKTLQGLSLRNREGQLLGFMLKNSDLFVSDQIIDNKFYTEDILGRSNLIKLLKNKFKLNKLKAIIKKQGGGYIFISIGPLYIN